ncbi:MAG: hypothetical protein ACXW03_02605 [Methylobacter sp.]
MSVRHRLAKLERRPDKEMSLEQIHARMRVKFGELLGIDLSAATDEELSAAGDEIMRQIIEDETGQKCPDWPSYRLLSEATRLVRGAA